MNEKRRKRAIYFDDKEYRLIEKYVAAKGRKVSGFIRQATLGEIKKHLKRNDLKEIVGELVEEEIIARIPSIKKLTLELVNEALLGAGLEIQSNHEGKPGRSIPHVGKRVSGEI